MYNASYGVSSILNTPSPTMRSPPPIASHYADYRFTRDFAAVEKARRDKQIQKRHQSYDVKRKHRIIEEQMKHQRENNIYDTGNLYLQNKQQQYIQRIRKNAHTTSLPLNPITFQYQNSSEGQKLYQLEEDKKMRGFLRAQYLEDRNTAGYNLLNGAKINNTRKLVPLENIQYFEQQNSQHNRRKYLD